MVFDKSKQMGVGMDSENKIELPSVIERLKRYEKAGVKLFLDGIPTNSEHIMEKCVREDTVYMADYITDDTGNVKEVRYDEISHTT